MARNSVESRPSEGPARIQASSPIERRADGNVWEGGGGKQKKEGKRREEKFPGRSLGTHLETVVNIVGANKSQAHIADTISSTSYVTTEDGLGRENKKLGRRCPHCQAKRVWRAANRDTIDWASAGAGYR